jgi:orotate phosphoribosyltransferase
MSAEKIIAEKLVQVEAVKLRPENPFTWASGWKSPIYCDNRKVLSHPQIREAIKSELCSVIFEQFPDADLLAGVATAGIAWGAMAADQLKLPFVYVRPKPKEHGLGNQLEGEVKPGQNVVVIEDLISTGKSSLQVCAVLREAGVNVMGMVSIFNYGFPESKAAFAEAGIPLFSLTNYEALIQLVEQQGRLTEATKKNLLNWRESPATWSGIV